MTETQAKYVDDLDLTKDLDRTKSKVFLSNTAAFLGSIMCSLAFIWDRSIETACTDGLSIHWSPDYFMSLPPDSRKTDLKHELWHNALLHQVRRGARCPDVWNIACDIKIDLMLEAGGDTFEGIKGVLSWPNLNAHQYVGWVEEDIYDHLQKNGPAPPPDYVLDLKECDPTQLAKAINNVVKAVQQAKLAGPGNMPGDLELLITKFLAPIVPWENYLHRFMQDLAENGYTWKKPNRRHPKIYLPSSYTEDGALSHLAYFEDTSGSITDKDALRFNSEFKYVKDTYCPELMSLIQFDEIIQHEQVYTKDDPFEQVTIYGRGGTSLVPVREWIIKNKPTAAIIFSDMQCNPMEPMGFEIPILWVCISNRKATVPFGQIIHIS